MRFVPKQCVVCPFRPTSARGWLGAYSVGDVFRAIWHGMPFFCHTAINYERRDWEARAMKNGKLCTGGLAFANNIHAPASPHPQIVRARELVKKVEGLVVMRAQDFGKHHSPEILEEDSDE